MPLLVVTALVELYMFLLPPGLWRPAPAGAGGAAEWYFAAICIAKLIPVKVKSEVLRTLICLWIPIQLFFMVGRLADGMGVLSILLIVVAWSTSGIAGRRDWLLFLPLLVLIQYLTGKARESWMLFWPMKNLLFFAIIMINIGLHGPEMLTAIKSISLAERVDSTGKH